MKHTLVKSLPDKPKQNAYIDALFILSVASSIFQGVTQGIFSHDELIRANLSNHKIAVLVYFVLTIWTLVNIILLVRADRHGEIHTARMFARSLVATLIVSFLMCVMLNGLIWTETSYLFHFLCVISYQLYNDPYLDRSKYFNPKEKLMRDGVVTFEPDGYIPLNFYNMFWIFVVASVIGLAVEMVFCLLVNDVWEDRAGLLWGPFSPIYGFGALILTIILNRFWKRNVAFIWLVAGVVGASFEFFVSWYMETAFGVVAWDYSGTFLNIDGRTNFAFFCAWGLLGVMWIRTILPGLMNVVDIIPLKWRAIVTVVMTVFMLYNGCMTVLALDCWSQRVAGYPVETEVQQYCEEHFDNDYMENRFQTMGINSERALRAQENAK